MKPLAGIARRNMTHITSFWPLEDTESREQTSLPMCALRMHKCADANVNTIRRCIVHSLAAIYIIYFGWERIRTVYSYPHKTFVQTNLKLYVTAGTAYRKSTEKDRTERANKQKTAQKTNEKSGGGSQKANVIWTDDDAITTMAWYGMDAASKWNKRTLAVKNFIPYRNEFDWCEGNAFFPLNDKMKRQFSLWHVNAYGGACAVSYEIWIWNAT